METPSLTIEQFSNLLPGLCDRSTSQDSDNWTSHNPLWGHCAVIALVAQDYFGGTLVRCSLSSVPELAYMRSHYWNQLPSGEEIDFTRKQFNKTQLIPSVGEIRDREYVLSFPDTKKRYEILSERIKKACQLSHSLD